ncbi:MAG: YkgJ family cysteine cluster protein [Thermoanaerobaculia bacterium]
METRRLTVELGLPEGRLHVEMDVPTGMVPMRALLPALRTTADAFVAYAGEVSEALGKPVSCAKGCGACCRQLVPVAPSEARRIADLVAELPEPRRSEVSGRFAEAVRRVEEGGLLGPLDDRPAWETGDAVEVGTAYVRLGIACPFLEDESCSIYAERPLACREYLVSSPPSRCASPTRSAVETIPLPTRVWAAAAREEEGVPASAPAPWVPLVLAPRWAAESREEPVRPGPDLLRGVYSRFARDRSGAGEPR